MKLKELQLRQLQSVGYLLIRSAQIWNERAISRVNTLAGAPVFREVHTRLLPLLFSSEGKRITEIADQLGLTKQAIQPVVAELKSLGVITVKPDEKDGRANRIILTPRGIDGISAGNDVLIEIERDISKKFTPKDMRMLRNLLKRLLLQLETEKK